MYNGVGLRSVRGSGTNGYVNSNKAFAKSKAVEKIQQKAKSSSNIKAQNNDSEPSEYKKNYQERRELYLKQLKTSNKARTRKIKQIKAKRFYNKIFYDDHKGDNKENNENEESKKEENHKAEREIIFRDQNNKLA